MNAFGSVAVATLIAVCAGCSTVGTPDARVTNDVLKAAALGQKSYVYFSRTEVLPAEAAVAAASSQAGMSISAIPPEIVGALADAAAGMVTDVLKEMYATRRELVVNSMELMIAGYDDQTATNIASALKELSRTAGYNGAFNPAAR